MFEKLKNRYYFNGEIELLNELHIGCGKGDERTDALVIKDSKGNPFIPGSSLRGALRATIERIAASTGTINPCLLIENKNCVTTNKSLQKEFRESSNKEGFLKDDGKVCPICQLFGSTVAASKIRITDLACVTNTSCNKFMIRDGVAIDRDTETAKQGAKYDFETVSKEIKFKFEMVGENLEERDIALLAIGIKEIIDGNFWIGGNSSRGLGKCKLNKLKITYFNDIKKHFIENKPLDNFVISEFLEKRKNLFMEAIDVEKTA